MSEITPILVYLPGVVAADAIMLNKQSLRQHIMTNNEKQLQRVDMMNTLCPVVIAQCLFCYRKCVNLHKVTCIIIVSQK